MRPLATYTAFDRARHSTHAMNHVQHPRRWSTRDAPSLLRSWRLRESLNRPRLCFGDMPRQSYYLFSE